jgi:hypothetical protein
MDDRICTDCNTTFEYPYQLERHKKNKKKCTNIQGNGVICKKCKKYYASKYTLERHYDSCKSKNIQEVQGNNSNRVINNNALSNINVEEKEKFLDAVQVFCKTMNNKENDKYKKKFVNTLTDILSSISN